MKVKGTRASRAPRAQSDQVRAMVNRRSKGTENLQGPRSGQVPGHSHRSSRETEASKGSRATRCGPWSTEVRAREPPRASKGRERPGTGHGLPKDKGTEDLQGL
uniref:Uncharacterized protein n=1 Tax=Ditylenchus dipsaci TaxID=166011 RepID=A0A915EX86_9BILA